MSWRVNSPTGFVPELGSPDNEVEETKGGANRERRCQDGADVVARGDCDTGEADRGSASIKGTLR